MKTKLTQAEVVLRHLKKHGHITPMKALNIYGIQRLAARIKDIRSTRWIKDDADRVLTVVRQDEAGRRFTEYQLHGHPGVLKRRGSTLFDGACFLGKRAA